MRWRRQLAAKHGVFIHAGSIMEKIEGEGRIHNTSVVFDRKGKEIARYRKIHLFDVTTPDGASYKESETVKAGDAVVTYDCEGVTVGCSICYDLRFPDLFQALAEKGAQVIALPAAFTMQTGKDHWETLLRARAIETETYRLRGGADRLFHRRQRAARDLRPFAGRRPLGPCRRQGFRRDRHRLDADRDGGRRTGAAADPGRPAQGRVAARLRLSRRRRASSLRRQTPGTAAGRRRGWSETASAPSPRSRPRPWRPARQDGRRRPPSRARRRGRRPPRRSAPCASSAVSR